MAKMFMDGDKIPDELLPYKEKLGPRFFEVRSAVIKFITDVIRPAGAEYKRQRSELVAKYGALEAPQPPIMDELLNW